MINLPYMQNVHWHKHYHIALETYRLVYGIPNVVLNLSIGNAHPIFLHNI